MITNDFKDEISDVTVYNFIEGTVDTVRKAVEQPAVPAVMATLPASGADLKVLPEGARESDARAFWSDSRLANNGDQIEWPVASGERYRVHRVKDYSSLGEHVKYITSLDV